MYVGREGVNESDWSRDMERSVQLPVTHNSQFFMLVAHCMFRVSHRGELGIII